MCIQYATAKLLQCIIPRIYGTKTLNWSETSLRKEKVLFVASQHYVSRFWTSDRLNQL